MVLGSGIIAIAIYIRLQRLRKYLFFENLLIMEQILQITSIEPNQEIVLGRGAGGRW